MAMSSRTGSMLSPSATLSSALRKLPSGCRGIPVASLVSFWGVRIRSGACDSSRPSV